MLKYIKQLIGSMSRSARPPVGDDFTLIRDNLDITFYSRQLADDSSDIGALALHYLQIGWRAGLDPSKSFSTSRYLARYGDVRASGMNPFVHFLRYGQFESRNPAPACSPSEAAGALPDDHQIRIIKEEFNSAFYLECNSDIDFESVDPAVHYLTKGAAEGRDPTPDFSVSYYLDANPDVKEKGIDPFYHYIVAGRREGRLPRKPGGFRADILRELLPLSSQFENWKRDLTGVELCDADTLFAALNLGLGSDRSRAILSFSHDDYTSIVGGVQFVMQSEQTEFAALGIGYINLHPVQPLPALAEASANGEPDLNILVDGQRIGTCSTSSICEALQRLCRAGKAFDLVIHSLHGHAPEQVVSIAEAASVNNALYWVHDYFSICSAHTLLRNNISYCGAPAPDSPACRICVFGERRERHIERIRVMFEAIDFRVAAPSEIAMDIWKSCSGLAASRTIVHRHTNFLRSPRGIQSEGSNSDQPIRVGFIGYPAAHKGWPAFLMAVNHLGRSDRFIFFHIGRNHTSVRNIRNVSASVTRESPTAMIDAIRDNQIDVVILWSFWPETFSFAAFEALAGGAAIVTHADSGNIARIVEEHEAGWVLADEDAMLELLKSDKLRNELARRRAEGRASGKLEHSRFTVDFVTYPPIRNVIENADRALAK